MKGQMGWIDTETESTSMVERLNINILSDMGSNAKRLRGRLDRYSLNDLSVPEHRRGVGPSS